MASSANPNWPKPMYVGGKEDGALRCMVPNCKQEFTDDQSTDTQVKHYTQCEDDDSLDSITRNEHGLLKQMHSMKACLICNLVVPDSRVLINHIIEDHPSQEPIFTVHGFLLHVRKFPHKFPKSKKEEKEYRENTFKLAYKHLELNLSKPANWKNICDILCYPNRDLGLNLLRDLLRVKKKNDASKYFPYHPDSLLLNLKYKEGKCGLSKGSWQRMLDGLREGYRKGLL